MYWVENIYLYAYEIFEHMMILKIEEPSARFLFHLIELLIFIDYTNYF